MQLAKITKIWEREGGFSPIAFIDNLQRIQGNEGDVFQFRKNPYFKKVLIIDWINER